MSFDFNFDIGVELPDFCTLDFLINEGVAIGDRYIRRQREDGDKLVPVRSFCAQTLLDTLAENPELLASVSKREFEEVCAEIFARRGFKVDLFRETKDDGIDFLAVQEDGIDPLVFAVQCKHPDATDKQKGRTLPVTTVREIFGVSQGMDMHGAIAITSSNYSNDAKRFTELKPDKIFVHNGEDVIGWISKFRWNADERS